MEEKYDFLLRYFDLFVDVLGESDILELTRLLKRVADSDPAHQICRRCARNRGGEE